jgi:hypothetical protein
MSTYNLSATVIDPSNEQPMTLAGKPLSMAEAIVVAMKMPTAQGEQPSLDDLNKRRKIIAKLSKAENKAAIALKSNSVDAIKEQVRKYYIAGVTMQILEAFDGEPTQAQLDDI